MLIGVTRPIAEDGIEERESSSGNSNSRGRGGDLT